MGCGCSKQAVYTEANKARGIAGKAVGAQKTKVNFGPLEIGKDGVALKPKFNVGIAGGSLHLMAGVGDVRDGLTFEGMASYIKEYSTHGSSLAEVLTNVKAEEKIPALDDMITAIPNITAKVLKMIGADIAQSNTREIVAAVYVYVGVGIEAGLFLGWLDTNGYRMVGLQGGFSTGAGLAFDVKAGLNENGTAARLAMGFSNVAFDAIIKLKEPAKDAKEPANDVKEPAKESKEPSSQVVA
jgi:hypothetical protein